MMQYFTMLKSIENFEYSYLTYISIKFLNFSLHFRYLLYNKRRKGPALVSCDQTTGFQVPHFTRTRDSPEAKGLWAGEGNQEYLV